MDRVVVILFILGLSGLSYLYGVASTRLQLFPYEFVHQAWLGGQALREAYFDDPPVPGVLSFAEAGVRTVHPAAGPAGAEDLILMTGGAGVLMEQCPELGCLAWIMGRDGAVYHAWPIDPKESWGAAEQMSGFASVENFYPTSLHLYQNGDLLASYQGHNTYPFGVGLAKFDWDGNLLWRKVLFNHHKFDVGADGTIYTPAHRTVDGPLQIGDTNRKLVCDKEKIYEDVIYIIDQDGEVIDEISVLQSLFDSGFAGLVNMTSDPCDPIHLNDVRVLSAEYAPQYPELTAGDLLISMRNVNALAVLDRTTRRVKWLSAGTTIRQHSPRYIGNNEILVLDNMGGNADQGGTRLVKINLASRVSETVFPQPDTPDLDFYTDVAGYYDLSKDGDRLLVSLTMQGRVLEIDLKSHQVVWEYKNLHDIDAYLEAKGETPTADLATIGINAAYYVDGLAAGSPAPRRTAGAQH